MDGTLALKKYKVVERLEALEEGGGGYELPVASDETLGGVKIGENLTITEEGVLSAPAPTPYTPPAYSITPVKVGTWIDGSDVMRVVYDNIQLTNNTDVVVDANFGAKKIVGVNCIGYYQLGDDLIYIPLQNYLSGTDYAIPKLSGSSLQITVKDNWAVWKACLIVDYVEPQESKNKKKK